MAVPRFALIDLTALRSQREDSVLFGRELEIFDTQGQFPTIYLNENGEVTNREALNLTSEPFLVDLTKDLELQVRVLFSLP